MNIGFDAKRITHNATGLGNYSRFVVNNISTHFPDHELFLYSPNEGKESLRNKVNKSPNIHFHYPGYSNRIMSSLWRLRGIIEDLKTDKIDIFHGLTNELPSTINKCRIPSVVTIHDLIFIRYPQLYSYIDRHIYNYKFKQACIKANKVIAVSEKTKEDIVSFYRIPEEKIEVIYQGCDPSFENIISYDEKQRVKNKYQISSAYILYVGSIEERKNLLLLVKALKEIKEDIKLIAIGKRTSYTETVETFIKENHLSNRVQILNNVPFQDLPAFYQMADLFVYPSFFEGFGIPIIEALHSNVPVIAATGSCLEEAGGPDSLYTNPNNITELVGLIRSILNDNTLAERMRTKGKIYVERFSSSKLTAEMINLYQRTI